MTATTREDLTAQHLRDEAEKASLREALAASQGQVAEMAVALEHERAHHRACDRWHEHIGPADADLSAYQADHPEDLPPT